MNRAVVTGIYDELPAGRPVTVKETDQFNHQRKGVTNENREPCEADRPTRNKETAIDSMARSASSFMPSYHMMQEKKKHDDLITLYYKVAIGVLAIFLLLALIAIGLLYYRYIDLQSQTKCGPCNRGHS